MRKNQKGFSVVEILIIILVVALIGIAGWLVYDRQNNKEEQQEQTSNQNNQTTDETTTNEEAAPAAEKKATITRGEYNLLSPADVSKLPPVTPESFKAYIAGKLSEGLDQWGCRGSYTITAISAVNIKGSYGYVNQSGQTDENCQAGGGAPVWALTPGGIWDETAGQDHADCTTINGGKVYEEFATECFAGSGGTNNVKNPNGSVTNVTVQ